MKKSIPLPLAVGALVAVLALIGIVVWLRAGRSDTGVGAVSDIARSIKSTRTDLPVIPKEVIEAKFHGAGRR